MSKVEGVSVDERLHQVVDRLHSLCVTLESVRVSLEMVAVRSEDHEARLRRLEGWKHRLNALAAVVAFVAGAAVTAAFERWP